MHPQRGGHEPTEITSTTVSGQVRIPLRVNFAPPLQVGVVPRITSDPPRTVEVPRKVVVVPFMGKNNAV